MEAQPGSSMSVHSSTAASNPRAPVMSRVAGRTMPGPSPRLGPAQAPQDEMQFPMDLEGVASKSASPALKPRIIASDEAVNGKSSSEGALVPARSRSTGDSRSQSQRNSFAVPPERAEKKPRLSAGGSSGATPMSISPLLGPSLSPALSSALVPLDADVQPATAVRNKEFQVGRRVFHVHFGHGYVAALEKQIAPGSSEPPQLERSITSNTHNIKVVFDNPKYRELRLRVFYAVPKMVVIPSAWSLRKRKKHQLYRLDGPGSLPAERVAQIKEALAPTGSLRLACELIVRWSLHHAFDLPELLKRLVDSKDFASAARFAREFNLRKEFPTSALLHGMLLEKRYDGALKACNMHARLVDGHATPADVLHQMVGAGEHGVALKYVHKFRAAKSFPPSQLVEACLRTKGELTVRTAVMLLKYVPLLQLEDAFPRQALLERVAASGIQVLQTSEGKVFIKGSRRMEAARELPLAPLKVGSAP